MCDLCLLFGKVSKKLAHMDKIRYTTHVKGEGRFMQSELTARNQEPWRSFLAELLRNDHDLVERIAERLGVREVTVVRWANGETSPHQLFRTLDLLAQALPEPDQGPFVLAVQKQYPEWERSSVSDDVPVKALPSIYYSKVIQTSVQANDALAFWAILSLLAQQLSSHLDPEFSASLTLSVCLCLPPLSLQLVSSLYIPLEQPNDHPFYLEDRFPLLLGMESSLAFALTSREAVVFSPNEFVSMEQAGVQSVAAHAIQRRGKVGGCLVITAGRVGYFTKARSEAVTEFSRLATLALRDEQLYPPDQVALGLLPSMQEQQETERRYSFRERMRHLRRSHGTLNQRELEKIALQDLEAELLTRPI
jgi:transcriptional regulator with XRE-family HTH domain